MAIQTMNVAVTASAERIDIPAEDGVWGYTITFTNTGPNEITFGGSDVVSGVGDFVGVGGRYADQLSEPLYAICASGETATLRVTQRG